MNIKYMTTKKLIELINNTSDMELLQSLEDEYVNRMIENPIPYEDDDIEKEILSVWKPS